MNIISTYIILQVGLTNARGYTKKTNKFCVGKAMYPEKAGAGYSCRLKPATGACGIIEWCNSPSDCESKCNSNRECKAFYITNGWRSTAGGGCNNCGYSGLDYGATSSAIASCYTWGDYLNTRGDTYIKG